MAFTKKNYVDLTGLSTFKSSLLGTVINDANKTTTSKTATIKAITDYVDSEVGDLSSAVTEGLANKVSSVTYDSTNKKIVYNKGGSTNTDVVTVATIKSAIGNFVKSGTGASSGLVPAPSTTAGTSKYLREDGTWVTPPNTTYSVFVKSGSGAKSGLVPAPSTTAGTSKYLREDGTWTTPPDTNTTYTNATASKAGLMGADDKAKLDGIATNANNYSHPTYTSKTSGFYKITVDGTGHVSGTTAVAKSDITALGIPGSDTTYSVFVKSGTGAKAGLVPAPSTTAGTSKYLREDGTWTTPPDTNTTYSNATSSSAGLMGADDKAKLDGITASADSVSFSRSLTSGTKVGTITINSIATDLYAPTNTDTHYTAKNVVASISTGTENVGAVTSDPYINLIENGAVRSTHRISGSGATTVKTDASGNIIISSTDTNTTYDNATASKAGLMGADDKAKLNGIAAGAEVNQNAFSNVKVGNVTVSADSKTDTLTLVAGSNVTITPDSANDKITISSSYTNTTYSAGTDLSLSGTTFNHATSGVTAGTYRSVTVNARGHVTGGSNPETLSGYGITDAKIENGVITLGSNTITPLTSSSSLNASKLTGTISVDRLPATALERCVVVANDTARFALTVSNVQVGDTVKVTATKKMYMVVDSSKLSTEAGYEEYFTSTDWSTITNKPSSYYTHPSHTAQKSGLYKITVDALGHVSGVTSVTKADITGLGIPGSDTNTHYTAIPVLGASTAVANATSSVSNPYLNIVENSVKSGGIQIKGGGATTVSAVNGVITISSTDTDTNTTYTTATSSTLGLVKSSTTGTTASRDYKVEVNSDGTMKVNVPWTDTNTTYSVVGAQNTTGLVKNGSSVTNTSGYTACPIVSGIPYYKDTNTTYSVFGKSGSTASTGLVPAPSTTAGSSKYLREDGSWATPPDTNTTYVNATSTSAGLMSSSDKAKLDGIAKNANNYSHPTYTSKTSGLYKITVDGTGHVSATTAVAKDDITALGIPGSDTKVTQNAVADSDYTNFRPLIFGSSNSGTAGFTPSTVTDGVYACKGLYVRPSAGLIHATTFEGTLSDVNKVKVAGKVTLQYNSSTESLDFVFA